MISRSTLIGALVVVELAIVGAAASALTGGSVFPVMPGLAHLHAKNAGAVGANALDRTFTTGFAPAVKVDVGGVKVIVETANAPTVRVIERFTSHGWLSGNAAPVVAEQTPEGIRVSTHGDDGVHLMFGEFAHDVRLIVPPNARVEVRSSDAIDASGLRTKFVGRTSEGRVQVRDHRGDLDVSSDDGRIYLTDVEGNTIAANTHSGRLYFDRVAAGKLDARTEFGKVFASEVRVGDGALSTHDGDVFVGFASDSDATAVAHPSEDNTVSVRDFPSSADGTNGRTVRLGGGRGRFAVSTDDGSIAISQGAHV